MKMRFLLRLQEWLMKKSSTPWACLETSGPGDDGRIPMIMYWNNAFIKNLNSKGYHGASEEETVQLFYIASQMMPEGLSDDTVNPSATPNLTSEANTLRR